MIAAADGGNGACSVDPTVNTPTFFRATLSHHPFAHAVAIIAALTGCGGVMASPPDASATGCPSGSDIQTQAAVGKACASAGLLCPEPACDPCSQNCHAVTCTGGVWVSTVNTAICVDAGGACVTIDPTSFDPSCKLDSDCMAIAAGTFCSGQPWCMCPAAAINVDGQGQYQADQQALQSLGPQPIGCGCPYFGSPRCIGNVCTVCGGANPCPDGG